MQSSFQLCPFNPLHRQYECDVVPTMWMTSIIRYHSGEVRHQSRQVQWMSEPPGDAAVMWLQRRLSWCMHRCNGLNCKTFDVTQRITIPSRIIWNSLDGMLWSLSEFWAIGQACFALLALKGLCHTWHLRRFGNPFGGAASIIGGGAWELASQSESIKIFHMLACAARPVLPLLYILDADWHAWSCRVLKRLRWVQRSVWCPGPCQWNVGRTVVLTLATGS